jgi:predicted AAA+ superfamily ATPase
MTELKRNAHEKINRLLKQFPAVVILGARQAGKTMLAKQVRPEWQYYDCEKPSVMDRIKHDPELFFEQNPEHIVLDEAQELPVMFRILRGVIDANRTKKGRFIITGSSSPELLDNISESLAGRVAIVELGTLKANELWQTPLSNFYQLFSQQLCKTDIDTFIHTRPPSQLSKAKCQQAWLLGGYPEAALANDSDEHQNWMENYYETYVNRDIAKLFPRLDKVTYQRFIRMLSHLSGCIINKSDLARNLEISQPTATQYLHIADKTYLWRQLPSFEKNITKSIIKMPKGGIRDSGLLNYLQHTSSLDSLFSHPRVGDAFETFATEEIIKGLSATNTTNWRAHYYRTRNGAEIDLILEGGFGQIPIEIKYGTHTPIKQLKTLEKYVVEHSLPFGIVVNHSNEASWLTRNIVQLPIHWL